jgi:DNA-binding protein H-NS
MAKTYAQLTQEIEALKVQAESVRQQEKAGVASRIREAIATYGLTVEELGFGRGSVAPKAVAPVPESKAAASTAAPTPSAVRYRDDAGNTWGGRGPKPNWLKAGMASGRSLESFSVNQKKERTAGAPATDRAAATPPPEQAPKKTKKKKFKSVIKYRDEAGHQWSGRGPQPGWVTAAIESGKTLAQLAA